VSEFFFLTNKRRLSRVVYGSLSGQNAAASYFVSAFCYIEDILCIRTNFCWNDYCWIDHIVCASCRYHADIELPSLDAQTPDCRFPFFLIFVICVFLLSLYIIICCASSIWWNKALCALVVIKLLTHAALTLVYGVIIGLHISVSRWAVQSYSIPPVNKGLSLIVPSLRAITFSSLVFSPDFRRPKWHNGGWRGGRGGAILLSLLKC